MAAELDRRQQTIDGLARNKGFRESTSRLRDAKVIEPGEFITSWGYISNDGISQFPGGRVGFGERVYTGGLESMQALVSPSDLPEGVSSVDDACRLVDESYEPVRQNSGVRRGINFYFIIKLRPGCETQTLIESIQQTRRPWSRSSNYRPNQKS